MGLRQLYFLLGGDLLKRLVYLSQGLAFILGFIGVKLLLHALHENELPFINGGESVHVPEIPTLASLGVIVVTLVITTRPACTRRVPTRRRPCPPPPASSSVLHEPDVLGQRIAGGMCSPLAGKSGSG